MPMATASSMRPTTRSGATTRRRAAAGATSGTAVPEPATIRLLAVAEHARGWVHGAETSSPKSELLTRDSFAVDAAIPGFSPLHPSTTTAQLPHESYAPRLDRYRRLFRVQSGHRPVLRSPGRRKHQRVLSFGARCAVVACRDVDGGHDVCRRYAAGGDGHGRGQRHRRQLAVVVHGDERDDDGVFLRAALAAGRRDDRHRVCRAALLGQAGGVSARVSRALPGHSRSIASSWVGSIWR